MVCTKCTYSSHNTNLCDLQNNAWTPEFNVYPAGYAQNGESFRASTQGLQREIISKLREKSVSVTFFYPTGPVHLNPQEFASFGHAPRKNEPGDLCNTYTWFHYVSDTEFRFDMGIKAIQELILKIGGIDGICGFSTGGALASIISAALEGNRIVRDSCSASWVRKLRAANNWRPLKFSIVYSGFIPPDPKLEWCFSPKIRTPTLHVMGELDTMMDKQTSEQLVHVCDNSVVMVHPGGHFVPKFRPWTYVVARFIIEPRACSSYARRPKE